MDMMYLVREASDYCGPDVRFLTTLITLAVVAAVNARAITRGTLAILKAPVTLPGHLIGYCRRPPVPLGVVAQAVLKALAGPVDVERGLTKDVPFHTLLASDLCVRFQGGSIREMLAGDDGIECLQHLSASERETITAKVANFVDAHEAQLKSKAEAFAAEAILKPGLVVLDKGKS